MITKITNLKNELKVYLQDGETIKLDKDELLPLLIEFNVDHFFEVSTEYDFEKKEEYKEKEFNYNWFLDSDGAMIIMEKIVRAVNSFQS